MQFLIVSIAAVVIVALCLLGMAVGVMFRNRPFESCGSASIMFRGERINCPGCVENAEEENAPTTPCGRSRAPAVEKG